jgi:UDP-N-acetylglucosamine--dolichyl-phosphate N-acetylglucosaminephosphotransferase
MGTRKRLVSSSTSEPSSSTNPQQQSLDPPMAPPKWGFLFKLSLFSIPYFYLIFYHFSIDLELRRSIIINAGLSLAGFFVTVRMIPVASRYVLRRNLFGFDINKKGTPLGNVRV